MSTLPQDFSRSLLVLSDIMNALKRLTLFGADPFRIPCLRDIQEMKQSDHLRSMKKSLELNVLIQAVLGKEITAIENLLALNKEKQATLANIIKEEEKLQKRSLSYSRSARVFAAPYFQDAKNLVPPPNEDTVIKRKNREVNAYFLRPPKSWTSNECKKLHGALIKYAILSDLKPLKRKRDRIKNKMQDTDISDKEREDLEDDLYIVEQKMRLVKRKPLDELMEQLKGLNIDWMTVSATHMEGIRSPEECEMMWMNHLSFEVNKEPFSKKEDDKLVNRALDYKERNWDVIAASLKTNRTAFQCFTRYKTKLKSNVKKRYWTKEDDDRLLKLIEKHSNGGVVYWGRIYLEMEDFSRVQIRDHYYRATQQRCFPGPFCPEEDALLIAVHQKHGGKWATLKLYFKRRSAEQIRERFSNVIKDKKLGPWTETEDKLLITMIKKHGYGQWAKIARDVPGRDNHQCLQRAKRLFDWSNQLHSERGKAEYDPAVYDPELFAKILKPFPKSKYREYHSIAHSKITSHREIGLKRLLKALKIVVPEYAAGIKDVNDIDVSWMSTELLHKLSDELHANLSEMEQTEKKGDFIRPKIYFKDPPDKRTMAESESDDEEDYVQPPQEDKISEEERDLVNSALHKMFEMQANVMPHRIIQTQDIGPMQWAEMSLYAEYLYKQFQCKTLCDKDHEKFVFEQVDYEKSVQNVVNFCIQPPVYDKQFIILAPNMTTLSGMETVEATEDRLHSISECVSHSKPYLDYLCERKKSPPQCLQCLHRSGKIASSSTPESMMSNMKKKSFLLDKRLKDSAYVEGASVERLSNSCICKKLEDSKDSVQLLRKRFLSLFTLPALLSAVGFSKEQESLISCKRTEDSDSKDMSPTEYQRSQEYRQKTKRKACRGKRSTKRQKLD